MKFCIFVVINLLILTQDTHGGLVGDFIDIGRNVGRKVHEDVHKVFYPNEDRRKDPVTEYVTKSNVNEKQEEEKLVFASVTPSQPVQQSASTPTADTAKVDNTKSNQESDKAASPSEKPASGSTSDPKDGRENFKGGCATGYQKTADGRCMPTF